MDYYEACRVLELARLSRESARKMRRAKKLQSALGWAQSAIDQTNCVVAGTSRETQDRLGAQLRTALHNNPKLWQSILEAGKIPVPCPSSLPAPAYTNRTTTTTGGFVLNLTTTTARTIDGVVGQVVLNGEIVHQTKPYKDKKNNKGQVVKSAANRAEEASRKHVHDTLRELLAD